ncbi:glyoxalase [Nonomuraea endophytica]|uniref:Putative lactoylglutathione lyase n=1 Tax=Nonomuraea endophytica TaxID=714136 RepID=A0A7W8ADQ3_9ACTN|nr:glyoxalase [Nonomuraea endophytica]MBB5084208.1 putative lactoylglutathione lyase [Nonomuraea endophytica]
MAYLEFVTLEVPNPADAERFYAAAFGLDERLRVQSSDAPTSGFRGFSMSLVVAQPSTVDSLFGTAVEAGAKPLKAVAKSLWGYGGVLQAPDGAIWTIASSSKKDTGPATRKIDNVVLQLGAQDVAASKRFYVEHGFEVTKSYGRKYVEFSPPSSPISLSLYARKALAKVSGVSPEGSGSHRLVIGSDAEPFTDPDGFVWVPSA